MGRIFNSKNFVCNKKSALTEYFWTVCAKLDSNIPFRFDPLLFGHQPMLFGCTGRRIVFHRRHPHECRELEEDYPWWV